MLASLLALSLLAAQAGDELAAKAARGKQAMAAGRFDEAAALYREIVRALPSEPGMLLNLGMAEAMAGRPREALPHLRAAVKLQPQLLPAWLFLGMTHIELGEPARAVEPLQKVLAAQPENDQARAMLADALLALDRYEAALPHFRKLRERAPDDPRLVHGLGRSYEGVARAAFEELQRSASESAFVLLLTADALLSRDKHAGAYQLYREALEKDPARAEAHRKVAEIYEKTGHADWAAAERQTAKAAPVRDCRAQPGLECELRAGRYQAVLAAAGKLRTPEALYLTVRAANELAGRAFRKLGELPASAEAALFRAELLRVQRRSVEAVAELRKAIQSWPRDPRLTHDLATSLYSAGDFESARPLLELELKGQPGSAQLAYLLGDTYLQLQQPGKAIPALEKSVASEPDLLPARAALGRAYVQAGQAARALPHLESAARTDDDGSLHYQLARAYQAAGQAEKAKAALAKHQQLRAEAEARTKELQEQPKITPPRR